MTDAYRAFLAAKIPAAPTEGAAIEAGAIHPALKPHQRIAVQWAVAGGRRALFLAFGLGKTVIQLETVRLTLQSLGGGRGLIVLPLGVRQEFLRDAAMLGLTPRFIRRLAEADAEGLYLTNYESVRDAKLDPTAFDVVSLDEAAVLRGFGGTKTFRALMGRFEGSGTRRFVATATPSPNEFIELLAYAAFLGIMDIGEAKTRWFKRDSTQADHLTLHPHKAREFWLWCASWALFLQRPSDLGPEYADEGYVLPPMTVCWHELPSDHATAGAEADGQARMFRDAAHGVSEAAREKRDSLAARVETVAALVREETGQLVIWCDRNDEQAALETALDGLGVSVSSLTGTDDEDVREARLTAWRAGATRAFVSKPVMYGAGVNLQQCAHAIFAGIGFKFYAFIQAIHRIHRFLQDRPVTIDLIYTEAERPIREVLEAKWARHREQVDAMAALIREYGLSEVAIASALRRTIGYTRREMTGDGYRLILADAVEEAATLPPDAAGLILTSIPFSTQYEYTPSYHDFGHTDDNAHFWRQMDFLTPSLYRTLQPGRVLAVHVKDRITPSGLTGLGFQTVQPFHAEAIAHYTSHGFGYLGMKTIVTDVVRENNQTYRLGWTEQCKDGSRMGCGMPEYVLLFRKPPTDRSNGYADVPVVKDKAAYGLERWQIDANGFQRASGQRLLTPDELQTLPHEAIFKRWRDWSTTHVYDYAAHVALGATMREAGRLPVTFNLLPPHSWHPDVWTDIARMRTLNTLQAAKGQEPHLCPMPFDLVERLIVQLSMPGEVVLDPFAGLGTVPFCAVKLGRQGLGIELNPGYFRTAVGYVEAAARQRDVPTLFDLVAEETSA